MCSIIRNSKNENLSDTGRFYKQVLGFVKHTGTDDDLLLYRLVHIDGG